MLDIILIADPRILSVEIRESNEPIVDLRTQTEILFGPSPEVPNNLDYTKMRKAVYDKLIQAQKMLPEGMRFRLYEGYRSLGLQEYLFNQRYEIVKSQHQDWSHEQIFTDSTRFVSPVVNLDGSVNIPPHSTGGAVDVCLVDLEGNTLDMGMELNAWSEDAGENLGYTDSLNISAFAQNLRKIMGNVLARVGFVNYPTEYWHWSYGDRYWAYHKNEPFAIYDSVK